MAAEAGVTFSIIGARTFPPVYQTETGKKLSAWPEALAWESGWPDRPATANKGKIIKAKNSQVKDLIFFFGIGLTPYSIT